MHERPPRGKDGAEEEGGRWVHPGGGGGGGSMGKGCVVPSSSLVVAWRRGGFSSLATTYEYDSE